jgi:hypothetical protein
MGDQCPTLVDDLHIWQKPSRRGRAQELEESVLYQKGQQTRRPQKTAVDGDLHTELSIDKDTRPPTQRHGCVAWPLSWRERLLVFLCTTDSGSTLPFPSL